MIFGTLEKVEEKVCGNHVPIGIITDGAYAQKDISKGSILTYDDLYLNQDSEIVKIRKKQDDYFKK